nr:sulfotransferase family 2 domain-containing protein [Ruegeria sp. HKCCD7255]
MLVFFEERLALLSMPKTGSTAYISALKDRADLVISHPPELKHASVRRFDRFFQTMFQKMFDTEMEIMAVVREPVDWLGSWYRYRSRPDLIGSENSTRDLSFDDFIQAHLQKSPPAFADIGRQSDFLKPRSNGAGATHIFKYDHQEEIRTFLENRLNCAVDPARENVSPSRSLELSEATRLRLRSELAAEFALYEAARYV